MSTMTAMSNSVTSTSRVFQETSDRLADLRPGYAKFYSIADLSTQSRRRWVPLDKAVDNGRVATMFRYFFTESGDRRFATIQVADAFAHGVIGRAMAGFVATGRIWDTGSENLAVRTDIDGGLDWAGVHDTTLRVLPSDPRAGAQGTIVLPCEEAAARWLACRSRATLGAVYRGLAEVSNCRTEMLWSAVGECILGAATIVPTFSGTGAETGHRRGQLVLQALHESGLPVRTRGVLPRNPGSGPLPMRERVVRIAQ